ncbi:MAG: hypothetical protein Q8M38_04150, partial [Phenylobacterium sp.]|nr:hypothetical protein [Phenylobacterium sp.]
MSNRTVKYVDIGLPSPLDYWNQQVLPNVVDYRTTGEQRFAMQAARDLWHIAEWVWHSQNPGVDTHDPSFGAWRNAQIQACPELAYLRDIADASKHCGLGRTPIVDQAKPRVVHYASMPIPINTYPIRELILVMTDGSEVIFDQAIQAATDQWCTI